MRCVALLPDECYVAHGPENLAHSFRSERGVCTACDGGGTARNPKHFFYAISLMASGFLVFFQWPPIPSLVSLVERCAEVVGLTSEVGTVLIWTLAALPAIFGLCFLYIWLRGDTCGACRGHGKEQIDMQRAA